MSHDIPRLSFVYLFSSGYSSVSLVIIVDTMVGTGFANSNEYETENETRIWTPIGNESIKSLEHSEELFDAGLSNRFVSIIALAKEPAEAPNLLTL